MERVDTSTNTDSLAPPTSRNAPGYFQSGDPGSGTPATIPGAEWFNMVQEELVNVVLAAGLDLDKASRTQVRDAIATLIQKGSHAVTIAGASFEESVTDGAVVLWDSGDFEYNKALADGSVKNLAVGIANVTDGELIAFGETPAIFKDLVPGTPYYLDAATPGAITATAPDDAKRIGIAKSATVLFVDIDHAGGGDASIGKHTYPIPAEAWSPTITHGCDWFARTEVAVGRPEIAYVAFDDGVEQSAEVRISMPKSWDGGPVQCQPFWSHAAANSYGVAFGFKAAFLGDNTDRNLAFGTEVIVTDTGGTADKSYVGDISAAITPSGTITDTGVLVLRCSRKVINPGDNLDVKARLEHVNLIYTTNAGTDD